MSEENNSLSVQEEALFAETGLDQQPPAELLAILGYLGSENGHVQVLPEWRTENRQIHFVYPSSQFLPPKLRQFIMLAEKMMKVGLA